MSSEDYGDSDYGDESMGDYGSDGSDQGYGSDGDFAYSDDDGAGMGSPLAKGTRVRVARRRGCRDRLACPSAAGGGRRQHRLGLVACRLPGPLAGHATPQSRAYVPTFCLQKTFVVMDKDELRERLKAAVAQVGWLAAAVGSVGGRHFASWGWAAGGGRLIGLTLCCCWGMVMACHVAGCMPSYVAWAGH